MPSVSPAPMHHPFPALSPMGMMAGGPLIAAAAAPIMRSATPTHMLPPAANPAFMQQQMAMMAMRPPFGALPGPAPGKISASLHTSC